MAYLFVFFGLLEFFLGELPRFRAFKFSGSSPLLGVGFALDLKRGKRESTPRWDGGKGRDKRKRFNSIIPIHTM
jgi:hypothetical protein